MKITLQLSVEELAIIARALRHACIEIEEDIEFETEIGATREDARTLLAHCVDVLEIWH